MIFSDRSIREAIEAGLIQIEPYEPSYVQPSSVDLRVGDGFRVFVNHRYSRIDPRDPQSDLTQLIEVGDGEPFMLHPGEFVLGSTLERVKLGNDVVARLVEHRHDLGAGQTLEVMLLDVLAARIGVVGAGSVVTRRSNRPSRQRQRGRGPVLPLIVLRDFQEQFRQVPVEQIHDAPG